MNSSPNRSQAVIRPHHALTVIVVAVIAVILAYVVLGWRCTSCCAGPDAAPTDRR